VHFQLPRHARHRREPLKMTAKVFDNRARMIYCDRALGITNPEKGVRSLKQ
jgi:hypothetical protein